MLNQPMTNSLTQLLLRKEREHGALPYLIQPRGTHWQEYTWAEVVLAARKVAAFLRHLGLKKGSHIGIISKNCAEWFIADFGISLANMVSVPLFANQYVESIHYVLQHAEIEMVFIGKLDDHNQVRSYIPERYSTIGFDYHEDLQVDHSWKDVMAFPPLLEIEDPEPDDLFTIIYSSGTTGAPKGAMYTHQAIANYLALFPKDLQRIQSMDLYKLVSYLPLAHVYERSAIELSSIVIPACVSFIDRLDKFTDNLQHIQPSFFTAVPRIWGVFQQKIEQKLSPRTLCWLLKMPFISWYIKKKIRKNLGFDSCTDFFSGASYLPININQFFENLGISILEGYGQTENLAYVTVALPKDKRMGYAGVARLGVDLRLSETKELLVRSPCLMLGYFKETEATKAAFTEDGWLKTGDYAEMDEAGRLKILGRVNENYKNQTGEFVAPAAIEKQFAADTFIDQLCLVGQGLPTNLLLVTLNPQVCAGKSREELTNLLQLSLHRANSKLLKFEKIAQIIVVKDPWTTANNRLTPTLKVKRRQVEADYADLVQKALTERQVVFWE